MLARRRRLHGVRVPRDATPAWRRGRTRSGSRRSTATARSTRHRPRSRGRCSAHRRRRGCPRARSPSSATGRSTLDLGAAACFECSVDGAAFTRCSSPVTLSGLAPGRHTLAVRSVDEDGRVDPTPAAVGVRRPGRAPVDLGARSRTSTRPHPGHRGDAAARQRAADRWASAASRGSSPAPSTSSCRRAARASSSSSRGFVPLKGVAALPVGTVVDARRGTTRAARPPRTAARRPTRAAGSAGRACRPRSSRSARRCSAAPSLRTRGRGDATRAGHPTGGRRGLPPPTAGEGHRAQPAGRRRRASCACPAGAQLRRRPRRDVAHDRPLRGHDHVRHARPRPGVRQGAPAHGHRARGAALHREGADLQGPQGPAGRRRRCANGGQARTRSRPGPGARGPCSSRSSGSRTRGRGRCPPAP